MANNRNNYVLPMGFNYGIDYRVGPRPALREITEVLPGCPPAIPIPREEHVPRQIRIFRADDRSWNSVLQALRYIR